MRQRHGLLFVLAGLVSGLLVHRWAVPRSAHVDSVITPAMPSARRPPFPWLRTLLAVVSLIVCAVVWPRGGELPKSSNTDFVRVSITGAGSPEVYWSITPAIDGSYSLSSVELKIVDLGFTESDVSVTFNGDIANGVEWCHGGVGNGLSDGMTNRSFTLGSETEIPSDEYHATRDAGLIRSTTYEGKLSYTTVTCSIDPSFVFSIDPPSRRYQFPEISLAGDVPLVTSDIVGRPVFDIDSGLYTSIGQLSPAVTSGSFEVRAEAQARTNAALWTGVLLGTAGGLITPAIGWLEARIGGRRRRAVS